VDCGQLCGLRSDYRREPVPMISAVDWSTLLELPVAGEGWEAARVLLVWPGALGGLQLALWYLTPDGYPVQAGTGPWTVTGGTATVGLTCAHSFRLLARLLPGPATIPVRVSWVRSCTVAAAPVVG